MTTTTAEQIVASCFLASHPCQKLHVHLLVTEPQAYLEALETLTGKNILSTLSQASKARILVALHATKQHAALDAFLPQCDVIEVTKACEILDRPRLMRQIQAKIAKIESSHAHILEAKQEQECKQADNRRTGTRVNTEEKPRRRRKRKYDILQRRLKELIAAQEEENHTTETCHEAHENTAVRELLDSASVSGALARKIRRWAQSKFSADLLEFIVMSGAMTVWTKLADLVHFNPKDFALPYFLTVAHGSPTPEGTFVHGMRQLMVAPQKDLAESFAKLAAEHDQMYKSYTFLRTVPRFLQEKAITALLAQHIPLGTAIWYLEELCGTAGPTFDSDIPMPDNFADEEDMLRRALAASMGESIDKAEADMVVANILMERLLQEASWMVEDTSKVASSFAKLVERILVARTISEDLADALMPAAKRRLEVLKETIVIKEGTGKTAVFGDASESMQTAIKAATIFAALVSVGLGGELCFFSDRFMPSPHARPETVEQVLEITEKIRAKNCTNLAAALWHYYEKKIALARIVPVTDEWENEACHGYMFADLFRKYKDEVSPNVELVLVGVGEGSVQFQESLRRHNIDFKRIEIDERRPDLTKFDALLRQMALLSGVTAVTQHTATEDAQMANKEEDFVVIDE